MTLSKAQRKANDKYISDHYSRVALSMPNDEAAALRQYCSDHGRTVAGFIRGLIRDGYPVNKGFKIADIDPRISEAENCFTISDKSRCIAGGVLEAILCRKGELDS